MIEKQADNKKNIAGGIAVIGMACHFPQADNYREFWDNLIRGMDCISEVNKQRWDIERYYSPDQCENKSISKWCGRVERMEYFDNQFFRISPREAMVMDPNQRQLLEASWQCIEDAGVGLKRLQEGRTAVYTNVSQNDYGHRAYADSNEIDSYSNLGNAASISANRISYCFGLKGPSMSIDAACASSLVALDTGYRALINGECDFALVGSANFILHHGRYISYSKARLLSPDGKCKTFDATANGFVPGEGVGVLLLQRLPDALNQKNHIHAVMKASRVCQIGGSISITAPKMSEQRDMILSAYDHCGFSPETVSYIEAHGTGTALGDPIEVEALSQAFRVYTSKRQFCKIGSVKTNIGHLEGTSGMAGVIKTVLMMKARKIPKTLNIHQINPIINFSDSPFEVAAECTDWKPVNDEGPLRAGVSSYGFGGAGGHILMEEYLEERKENRSCQYYVFTLSAKSQNSLHALLEKWKEFTGTPEFDQLNIQDICGTTALSRSDFEYRVGLKIKDKDDLINKLGVAASGALPHSFRSLILQIGTLKLCGFLEVKDLYQTQTEFRFIVNDFEKLVSTQEWEGLFEDIWQEKHRELYSFMIIYSFIKTLETVGVRFSTAICAGEGTLPMLAYTEVIKKEDVVKFLLGKKTFDEFVLLRPGIDLYDSYRREKIKPNKLEVSFLKRIRDNIKVDINSIQKFILKAKKVYRYIYTYKKLVEEWRASVSKTDFDKIESVLIENEPMNQSREVYLILFILISSMRRLNHKWDLKSDVIESSEEFNVLLKLYENGIITRENVVSLITADEDCLLEEAAKEISNRETTAVIGRIEKMEEIENKEEWIMGLKASEPEYIGSDDEALIHIGPNYNDSRLAINLKNMFTNILLHIWNSGFDVAIKSLYEESSFYKVPLPVYEFDEKPFLIQNQPVQHKIPMVPERKFLIEDVIIRDHVIINKNLIPGASFLQFSINQMNDYYGLAVNTLRHVVFLRPCIVENEKELIVKMEDSNFTVNSSNEVLCKGQCYTEENVSDPSIDFSNIESYPSMNSEKMYDFLYNMGYKYGESLKVIHKIWKINQGYIFQIDEVISEKNEKIGAALLDGVFQSVLGTGFFEGEIENTGKIYIPFKIKELKFLGSLRGSCYVTINKNNVRRVNGDLFASLDVYDNNGRHILWLKDICLKECPDNFLLSKSRDSNTGDRLINYELTWLEQRGKIEAKVSRERIAVAFIPEADEGRIYSVLHERYEEIFFVIMGKEFSRKENKFIINPEEERDFLTMLDSFKNPEKEYDLFYLWDSGNDSDTSVSIRKMIQFDIHSIFNLCKASLLKRIGKKLNILVAATGSKIVEETDEGKRFLYGGLEALARTIRQENPKINLSVIDFESLANEEKARILMEDRSFLEGEPCTAYRKGKRYVHGIERQAGRGNALKKIELADGDTYLIIGGLGGVGYLIVDALSKISQFNLVILGSSSIDRSKQEKIEKLSRNKAIIKYYQCNIIQEEELAETIRNIKQQFGVIHGVIHCGGKNDDKLLMSKDWSAFTEVMNPKILGTCHLNELTRKEPLKFFVSFSSIVSIIGNIGQSDYAYGNGVLDTFMDYRKRNAYPGISIGINWTIWDNLGMGKNKSAIRNFEKKTGLIFPAAGVNAFIDILCNGIGPTIVISDDKKFESYLIQNQLLHVGNGSGCQKEVIC
ncbi:SDR family NAD(P)-dependent oxidoreductase [Lacrimispora sp. 38-1]|uniref:SDR family NAD(P)-dependent oxidoreductase n=1 Tax=Lacrimispora sp. 38-1 TaxID=3125778 RepID=UPI003CEF76F3